MTPTKDNAAGLGSMGGAEGHEQGNTTHSAESDRQRKALAHLTACFALAGWEFNPIGSAGSSGPFRVLRWNMSRELATMAEAEAFAQQVGVLP